MARATSQRRAAPAAARDSKSPADRPIPHRTDTSRRPVLMKRHTLILLMVGCLTLAACSHNAADSAGGNTASPGSTANPATNPTAAASPTSAPNPNAPGPGGSATNPTDAATPTPPQPTDPAGGGATPDAGPADPLDQHTTQWFDTFCSTLATVASTRSDTADLNLGDAVSMQSALIGALTTLGEVFHTATSTLAGLPPPTVTGGDHLAVTVTTAFGQDAQQ